MWPTYLATRPLLVFRGIPPRGIGPSLLVRPFSWWVGVWPELLGAAVGGGCWVAGRVWGYGC